MNKFIVSTLLNVRALVCLFLTATLTFLQEQGKTPEPQKTASVKNIKKVFMHFPNDYSIMYQEGKELKVLRCYSHPLIRNNISAGYNYEAVIMLDAEPEDMWAEFQMWNQYYFKIIIHVDSADAFGGGGFTYGKHGRDEDQVQVLK